MAEGKEAPQEPGNPRLRAPVAPCSKTDPVRMWDMLRAMRKHRCSAQKPFPVLLALRTHNWCSAKKPFPALRASTEAPQLSAAQQPCTSRIMHPSLLAMPHSGIAGTQSRGIALAISASLGAQQGGRSMAAPHPGHQSYPVDHGQSRAGGHELPAGQACGGHQARGRAKLGRRHECRGERGERHECLEEKRYQHTNKSERNQAHQST